MNFSPSEPSPSQVLDFWLGGDLRQDWPDTDRNALWFGTDPAQDQLITQRFGGLVHSALKGGLHDWEALLDARLALIILLDQFTRNVYRGQPQAFAGDSRAQQLAVQTLALGQDKQLPRVGRLFLYMPLMHAENPCLQRECVLRFTTLQREAPPELAERLAGNLRFAIQHQDIITRYGRFPYRNAVLGRTSTPDELLFLKDGPRFGQ